MGMQLFPPGNTPILHASKHLGRAPGGGSGAQLYQVAENDNIYLIKLKGNNQGIRVLFNEYVSGRLGELMGVPFGEHVLVEVSDAVHPVAAAAGVRTREPGTQFGTLYFENAQSDLAQLRQAQNFDRFPSVLVFDTFIARGNSRQYAVYPSNKQSDGAKDMGTIFDQGFAFTGTPNWDVAGLQGPQNCTANNGNLPLRQWFPTLDAYEPYIRYVEQLSGDEIGQIVHEPPLTEWQVSEEEADAVVDWLDSRKMLVREAIETFLR